MPAGHGAARLAQQTAQMPGLGQRQPIYLVAGELGKQPQRFADAQRIEKRSGLPV
ncbi:MAG: hypothetical protein ACR2L9_06850 [Solirubrobacteraceae bacterium]